MGLRSLARTIVRSTAGPTSYRAPVRVIERRPMYDVVVTGEDEPAWSGQGRAWRHGYRPYSAVSYVEADLDWWDTAMRAEQAWRQTALGRRVIETTHSMALSRDVSVVAVDSPSALAKKDPNVWGDHQPGVPRWTVHEILQDFWQRNELDSRLWDFELALRVRGTEFLPVFVRRSDGRVRIRALAGRLIDIIDDPDDADQAIAVAVSTGRSTAQADRQYRVIHRVDSPGHELDGQYLGLVQWNRKGVGRDLAGEVWDGMGFLFRINRLPNYKWGWTDLLTVLDFLDQADDLFFDILERVYWLSSIVWKWTFEGADWNELAPGGKYHTFVLQNPPRSGANLLTNQLVSVEPNTPNFASVEMLEYVRIVSIFVGAFGFGIPPMVLGIGEGANRAIAMEQGAPTRRLFTAYQALIRSRWSQVCSFVVDSAIRAGRLPERTSREGRKMSWDFAIELPSMDVRDLRSQAQTVLITAQAVTAAKMLGLAIDDQTWIDTLSHALKEFGVSPTLAEMDEKGAIAEAAKKLATRYQDSGLATAFAGWGNGYLSDSEMVAELSQAIGRYVVEELRGQN